MKTFAFYGRSDDCTYGGPINDEEEYYNMRLAVNSDEGSVHVVFDYGGRGVWAVGLAPTDEDAVFPEWPIAMRMCENGYSTLLTMEVPDDAVVEPIK